MVHKDYPVIYIAKPRIKINFDCLYCSAKYKTINISIRHNCKECGKENKIRQESYSLDSTSFYLTMAMANLKHSNGIILRATDSYILLLQSLIDSLTTVGLRVVKNHKITDVSKKKQKDIIVNEVILEKLGAIR